MNNTIEINAIYTYKNPFELEQMPQWSELKQYPHLCISQTLVEGLKEYYGRSAFPLLATVDSVLKKFYTEWHDSPENTISQTVIINDIISEWANSPTRNKNLVRTMKHNRKDIVKAVRMMIESDIVVDEINPNLQEEEILFLELYKRVYEREEFSHLNRKKEKNELDKAYLEVLKDEMKKYLKQYKGDKNLLSNKALIYELDKQKDRLKNKIKKYRNSILDDKINPENKQVLTEQIGTGQKEYYTLAHLKPLFERYQDYEHVDISTNKIVLHGVHQFSPLILRLIRTLNEMGIEVIAMFNYMGEYPEIYKTWKTVYSFTERDFNEWGNAYPEKRKLGETIGKVYERDFSMIGKYNEKYYMFDHLTSFSDYVGNQYEKAVKKFDKIFNNINQSTSESTREIPNEKLIKIAFMNEQFYAINGTEINELLKVYFPEQFSSRHFLTYPVGQFILSLYRMWDDEKETIQLKGGYIKEALALDIWSKKGMPTPIDMFNNLEYYFRTQDNFEDYLVGLGKLKKIAVDAKYKNTIGRLSFFIYGIEELEYFEKILKEIRRVAKSIFANKKDNLKENFKKLIDGIESLVTNPNAEERVTNDEKVMLSKIQVRLEDLKDTGETTYISNIKETLGYYIQASTSNEYEAEWIVRDFEQIDGGVLLAAAQNRDMKDTGGQAIFHYAGVSDENLLGRAKKELPWPLTTKLYESFGNEIAKICAICRNEYNYFLRYSLFYGTYFLADNKQIRLSYIKEMGDQEAHPYSVLANIMKLEIQDYIQEELKGFWDGHLIYGSQDNIPSVEIPEFGSGSRSMETCFRRYLWNHCLDNDTYFQDEFQLERVAKFFIEYIYLAEAAKRENENVFNEQEFQKFIKYIPIFDKTDQIEIRNNIIKRLSQRQISYRSHSEDYINNGMEFIYRDWKSFKTPIKEVVEEFKQWLENEGDGEYGPNCKNCNQHNICCVVEDHGGD